MIYFSDFSAPAGGPSFSQVMLLMGFEGADGAQTFVDESSYARTISRIDNVQEQIDTAQFKYGSSSLLLDGSFDGVRAADSSDWDFGTGAFCIEAWIRPTSVSGSIRYILFYGTTSANWDMYIASDGKLRVDYVSTGGATTGFAQATATMTTGNWYHVAFDRDSSGNGRLYLDGVVVAGPTNINFAHRLLSGFMRIGRNQSSGTGFAGHIDEVRIIKGATPYGGAFTPPASAFPRS